MNLNWLETFFFLKVVRQGYDVKSSDFGAFQHCTTALLNLYIQSKPIESRLLSSFLY